VSEKARQAEWHSLCAEYQSDMLAAPEVVWLIPTDVAALLWLEARRNARLIVSEGCEENIARLRSGDRGQGT